VIRAPATHVISSMPLPLLLKAMRPPIPYEVREAADGIHFRDHLSVALVVPEDAAFPDNWIYVHSPTVRLGRIQNFGSWSPYMVKEGRTCLGLEYFVFEGDDLWETSDEELIALGKRELATLGLIEPARVEAGYVVRMPKAYPTYDENYRENVETLKGWLADHARNVCPVGRNGMHKYNNQDHSMYTAMLTVENIVHNAGHDIWSVNVEAEYHEEVADAGGDSTGRDAPIIPRHAIEEAAASRRAERTHPGPT
jgi:protoporphyrinogen oxidase